MRKILFFGTIFLSTTLSCVVPDRAAHEVNGMVMVEAEDYDRQEADQVRKWYVRSSKQELEVLPDPDSSHWQLASGGAYVEILPDTRTNHDEKLIRGENFINEPGKIGILHYDVVFKQTGRYYVWVRAYSTGSEDNGIHVGVDGEWPASGQRMQWCDGKHQWTWESKQRTQEVHCGEPRLIYLDINQPGHHTISFSMREDGFEFDQWMMSKTYQRPDHSATSLN